MKKILSIMLVSIITLILSGCVSYKKSIFPAYSNTMVYPTYKNVKPLIKPYTIPNLQNSRYQSIIKIDGSGEVEEKRIYVNAESEISGNLNIKNINDECIQEYNGSISYSSTRKSFDADFKSKSTYDAVNNKLDIQTTIDSTSQPVEFRKLLKKSFKQDIELLLKRNYLNIGKTIKNGDIINENLNQTSIKGTSKNTPNIIKFSNIYKSVKYSNFLVQKKS
jgi:hypothetical protein